MKKNIEKNFIWSKKYHHLIGTHCWFCDREYETNKCLTVSIGEKLKRTREHIIPRSKIIQNISRNYIGSCVDCNNLKRSMFSDIFAEYINRLIEKDNPHKMYDSLPTIEKRAWKIYNKTSFLHRNYWDLQIINKRLQLYVRFCYSQNLRIGGVSSRAITSANLKR